METMKNIIDLLTQQIRYQKEAVSLLKELNGYEEEEDSEDCEDTSLEEALRNAYKERDSWKAQCQEFENRESTLVKEMIRLRNQLVTAVRQKNEYKEQLQHFKVQLPNDD